MTNLDIETFWAVVQHGTMTAAAEALYITQPTLSMRVRALEERVGTPLFIRSKGQRRIQLTDAGQKFLTLARRWQRLLAETDALSELEQRVYLRIAATYTTNQYILPAVYQRFLSLHLPVSLWIHTLRDVDSAQALLNHELDFALIDSNTVFNSQLEVRPIFRERFCCSPRRTVSTRRRQIPPRWTPPTRSWSHGIRTSCTGTTAPSAPAPAPCCTPTPCRPRISFPARRICGWPRRPSPPPRWVPSRRGSAALPKRRRIGSTIW